MSGASNGTPVRTLLIDNHDSYTYNLYQLIAGVNGVSPVVVRNDDLVVDPAALAAFDNVVISPGPGRPDRARDFHASTEVVADSPVPVFGVCLGHQGIAVAAGARLGHATEPRHGHLTTVTHAGTPLFEGIPQGFTAVRYHSLAVVEPLPESLEVLARAEDGVVMALRHRDRDQWGVQFHPESVCTEFGARLLDNVARLSRAARRRDRTTVPRSRPDRTGRGPQPRFRVLHRVVEGECDTQRLYDTRYAHATAAFWLDSSRVEDGLSRFSFLGDGRGPHSELVTYRVGDRAVRVTTGGDGRVRHLPGTVFDHLRAGLAARALDPDHPVDLPFDLAGGYVGWFGYELKADCGGAARFRSPTPDAGWLFADRFVGVDHLARRTHLVALTDGSPEDERAARGWLDDMAASVARCLPGAPTGTPAVPAPRPGPPAAGPVWDRDRGRYLADIESCLRALRDGESYEICLTTTAELPGDAPAVEVHRELRRRSPAPYAALLRLAGVEVVCSSPERFLRVEADGTVETKPIKGTAPRGATPEEDSRLRDSLAADAKTRAENLMIVDLLRNDLGRVCEVGSVTVPSLMAVESYATVHQLVSTVRGRLRRDGPEGDGVDALACVRAAFPGGSMTGAPKERTLEIIDELEVGPRGVYSGSLGYLSCTGAADLNIVIRTAVRAGGRWTVGAGGAIVLGSDPAAEYDEVQLKAAAVVEAHRAAVARTTAAGVDPVPGAAAPVPAAAAPPHAGGPW